MMMSRVSTRIADIFYVKVLEYLHVYEHKKPLISMFLTFKPACLLAYLQKACATLSQLYCSCSMNMRRVFHRKMVQNIKKQHFRQSVITRPVARRPAMVNCFTTLFTQTLETLKLFSKLL